MGTTLPDTSSDKLALLGGPKTVERPEPDLFHWPIVTDEDEQAVLAVLRAGTMSGTDITRKFEAEYAKWQGTTFGLASCNGTMSLIEAMFGCRIGRGDELICPSITYWASALQTFALGATPVFCDIDPVTLCLDPMGVHYCGHPADMDAISALAKARNIKVIEDNSHAHGSLHKGKMTGALADVSCASMMASKSFPVGEGGMLCTNDREIYERAVAFA